MAEFDLEVTKVHKPAEPEPKGSFFECRISNNEYRMSKDGSRIP